MMKKRIVALLLAGLMTTAALASCRVQTNTNDNPGGTEPNQNNNQTTTTKPEDTYNPPVVTWQDVDKYVYTVSDTKLRQEANATGTALADIAKVTELHCTKQSTSWYYVEYDGKQGYVSKTAVTEVNITGSDMVAIEGGSKVMYVKTPTLNVRLYPSDSDTFSTKMGSYNLNDEVVVLATNDTWARIQFSEDKTYYVAYAYLSDTQIEDPNDTTKYEGLFTDAEDTPVMYVDNVSQVRFRKAPNTLSDELLALSKGDSVTVLKTGEVDGKQWAYAVVEVAPTKPGDGPSYVKGYISLDCLSYTNGDTTLEDILKIYPAFTRIEATTMYVLLESSITIRSTPIFPGESEDNSLSNPYSTSDSVKALTVLATGEVDGTTWFVVEYTKKEGENTKVIRGFVGGKALNYLTSDPSGKETVTLEDLMLKYPGQFEKLETPATVTTNSIANCYGTPAPTQEPLKQLAEGTEVTLVAKEVDSFITWAVIKDADGALYFVYYSLLNQAQ